MNMCELSTVLGCYELVDAHPHPSTRKINNESLYAELRTYLAIEVCKPAVDLCQHELIRFSVQAIL